MGLAEANGGKLQVIVDKEHRGYRALPVRLLRSSSNQEWLDLVWRVDLVEIRGEIQQPIGDTIRLAVALAERSARRAEHSTAPMLEELRARVDERRARSLDVAGQWVVSQLPLPADRPRELDPRSPYRDALLYCAVDKKVDFSCFQSGRRYLLTFRAPSDTVLLELPVWMEARSYVIAPAVGLGLIGLFLTFTTR